MSDASDVLALTAGVLAENYDAGSIDRGVGYADDRRVRLITTGPGLVSSVVEGSGRNTYVVRVAWRELGGGIVIDDTCSCPLGGFCKHAVATILTAQIEAVGDGDGGAPESGPSWRDVLGDLAEGTDVAVAGRHAPLALQLSVAAPRTTYFDPDPTPQLSARPMRLGKRDKWIKTGASWRDLYYAANSPEFDPIQVAALRALWNASPRHSYYPDTGPMSFSRFGPELWIHLRNVAESGVAFIDDGGHPDVRLLEETARVEVDLTTEWDDSVRLATRLHLGDDPLDADTRTLGFLGTPPHGVFVERDHGGVALARFDKVLSPAVLRMLRSPALHVPAGEVQELLDVYQPVLARRASVGSSDGSVTISTRRFDGLGLRIERQAVDVASTSWEARYVRGDVVSHFGLAEPGGGARDWDAETAAVAALDV
ncbi:MAG TPA: SWIM zinc finger family protein, partial [Acidimicrobiales bacterium]|nr:SWIM zinc finger family protein [Acidimicrobiales bacterium]